MKFEVTYRRAPEEIAQLLLDADPGELAALCDATTLFYQVSGEAEAILGLIYPSLMDSLAYVWIVADWTQVDQRSLRSALVEGRKFLAHFPGELRAEVATEDAEARRFAEAFGFKQIADLGDRQLMKWGE